jgi:hypothetical protein
MTEDKSAITPETRVNDLLNTYPELEDVLIEMAPPFKKLKNPFLRRTVAKVATMKHIASVGNIPLTDLINQLRAAVGQAPAEETWDDEEYFTEQPEWFDADKITISLDEDKVEDKDRMTLAVIMQAAKDVHHGEIIELVTTFLPAPGIDMLISKGYSAWTMKAGGGIIKSYFLKSTD